MKTVVLGDPPEVLVSLIADRKRLGLDTHDEVWQGEYHMAPAASFEHSTAITLITELFLGVGRERGFRPSVEFNLGSPANFRVPDAGLHRGSPRGVWLQTAAIVVEIRSPDDESYDKFSFYFDHDVEEILIADLATQTVQWFVRGDEAFEASDVSALLSLTSTEVAAALDWLPSAP